MPFSKDVESDEHEEFFSTGNVFFASVKLTQRIDKFILTRDQYKHHGAKNHQTMFDGIFRYIQYYFEFGAVHTCAFRGLQIGFQRYTRVQIL